MFIIRPITLQTELPRRDKSHSTVLLVHMQCIFSEGGGVGGLKERRGGLNKFLLLKRGGLLEAWGLFETDSLKKDLR